jgi:glyoxylase I family protein
MTQRGLDEVSSTATFRGARLHHIFLLVTNLAESLSFYQDLLGFEVTHEFVFEAGAEVALDVIWAAAGTSGRQVLGVFPGSSLEVELIEWTVPAYERPAAPRAPWQPGLQLLSFSVDNMDQVMAEVKSRGIPCEFEPQAFTNGARLVMINDPDGNKVELIEFV